MFIGGEDIGGEVTRWLGAADGIDRSRRSFMPEVWGAGFEAAGDVNEEKSPNPLELGFCAYACEGGDFGASKKLPPPPNIFEDD